MKRRAVLVGGAAVVAAAAATGAVLLRRGGEVRRRVLVLGGTRFVGRHIVAALLARGDEVTLFNRGKTAPGLFPGAQELFGDRGGELEALQGRSWDLVIDSSGTKVDFVRRSVARLVDATERYVYISSVAVYGVGGVEDCREDAELRVPASESTKNYGEIKVLCEREVQRGFAGRAVIVRPAVLVGPHDNMDRFVRWMLRARIGGPMLVPGPPEVSAAFTDARDLAAWIAGAELAGTYNVAGAGQAWQVWIAGCIARGSDACAPVWVDAEWAGAQGLKFESVPPRAGSRLDGNCSSARAVAAGLTFRGIDATLDDTRAWLDDPACERRPELAMSIAREAELLAAWQARG